MAGIEKHQGRRFPAASIEQALSILRLRVSGCLAESIQLIKSLRAIGVRSLHFAFASGAAARALPRSFGTLSSSPAGLGFVLFIHSLAASLGLTPWRLQNQFGIGILKI